LALSPNCHVESCGIFVGAAGGGVWTANNALASHLNWHPSSNGIPSNSIGSIIFDPTDAMEKTLYVGTGEANGSSDSEAGVGLYKSTNLGHSWSLVSGSPAVSAGRAIATIAVDPINSKHIFIGTAVARHGASSVNGGRFSPPGVQPVGLYESNDGGATFTLAFSRPSDVVNPGSANGSDFFRGGVTNVVFNRTGVSENAPLMFTSQFSITASTGRTALVVTSRSLLRPGRHRAQQPCLAHRIRARTQQRSATYLCRRCWQRRG